MGAVVEVAAYGAVFGVDGSFLRAWAGSVAAGGRSALSTAVPMRPMRSMWEEKTLHANMGGHTGVPQFAGEDAAGFFARHLR